MGHAVSLFLGIFFAAYGTNSVWGNLVSYFVLHKINNPQKFNCGIYFDPLSENGTATSPEVSDLTVSNQLPSNACSLIHSRIITALCSLWHIRGNGYCFDDLDPCT